MKQQFLIFLASVMLTAACNTKAEKSTQEKNESDSIVISGPQTKESAKEGVEGQQIIVEEYLAIKNALANDDSKEAASAANILLKELEKNGATTPDATITTGYKEIIDEAKEHAEHIEKNSGNISHQRHHFVMLSEDVYDLVKKENFTTALFYVNCPMYDDGKGANWLSESKEIKNPYMGKAMLTCGVIKEELK